MARLTGGRRYPDTGPVHAIRPPPVIDLTVGLKGSDRIAIACGKCGDSRRLDSLVDASRCWPCDGAGQVSILAASYRTRIRVAEKRAGVEVTRWTTFDDRHQAAIAALVGAGIDNLEDLILRSGDPAISHVATPVPAPASGARPRCPRTSAGSFRSLSPGSATGHLLCSTCAGPHLPT